MSKLRRMSVDELSFVAGAYEQGLSMSEIGHILDENIPFIATILNSLGIDRRQRYLKNADVIARLFG